MTTVVFETGTIAETLRKVARVLPPIKDQGFDLCNGIILHIPGESDNPVIAVQGTNLEVFYTEWISAVSVAGPATAWRLPPRLADLVSSLPTGTGRETTFAAESGVITVSSGRMSGTLRLISPAGYPAWEVFPTDTMASVAALGDRIAQISWACHEVEAPLTGIYADGKHLVATKRYSAARVPCVIDPPPEKPIIAPMKLLGQIIRHSGDVMIKRWNNLIAISPDDTTQVTCVTFDEKYPQLDRVLKTEWGCNVAVSRKEFTSIVSRLDKVVKDKESNLQIALGGGIIQFAMRGSQPGEIFKDSMDAPEANHQPIFLSFSTAVLLEGMGKAEGDVMRIHYNVPQNQNHPVYITDDKGYETWYMQRIAIHPNN